MGCCTSAKKKPDSQPSEILCRYPRSQKTYIKIHNTKGTVIDRQGVSFTVTEPILTTSTELDLLSEKILISSCVLPGFDPRGEHKKACQDNCFYLSSTEGILCCLFDGHGDEGEKVVAFCERVIEKFFTKSKSLFTDNPYEFIRNATIKCDSELLKKSSGIDSEYSGCTGVIICITATDIYCGSVGDSRGIIATTSTPEVLPAPPASLGEERKILAEIKRKRKSFIGRKINSIQLTRDQKPEDPEEKERILKAGGRVQKLKDEIGNEIGPFRVWRKNEDTPGLAMSRSIGDKVAKSLGVISEPVCTSYKRSSDDLFIVIASDGIWDAMDNKDVGTFVECNRGRCKKGVKNKGFGKEVHFGNAYIAQILCEEARLRWYTIVEEEDVMIDDISCIVIEIKRGNEVLAECSKGAIPVENNEIKITDEHSGEADKVGLSKNRMSLNANIRDPRRGSSMDNRA
ncbi:hypothetical protein SteCoe_37100 [Stentor coeruleus]|uniref:PPM-type phosphatase domain-containing protein n=1 Tax=Stentor coeruleus TaxID=5963 RepID=A0A1R2ANR9_9CILI|nr:hypothetical protein SteCoe_37100 [Stentor coeruleus]